ncbi:MAG: pyridoxal 5'-phosphate synthase glutaminase subunit PdxT [Bdellovibrionota bacterium]
MRVGILAVQGCVEPHRKHVEALGAELVEVRRSEEFKSIDALILPGGESTTMLKLIEHFGIWEDLLKSSKKIPFWGICAGSILMAKKVANPTQKSLGILDIDIQRNGYGRQLDSLEVAIQNYKVAFIRAPILTRVGKSCEVLADFEKKPVWVKQGRHMLTTFHSELNPQVPSPFHRAFLGT